MRLLASSILNLLVHPLGFLLLNDLRLSLIFLILPIAPLLYIIVYILSFFDSPWLIIFFLLSFFILFKSIIIFYTFQSYRSINNRKKLNNYGTLTNIFLILIISLSYFIIEDFCLDILKENLISANKIINRSTEPSLQLGDYVFIKRHSLNIERGDFIVYKQENSFEENSLQIIKRVIGIPGDKIKIVKSISNSKYETYAILLNGKSLETEETNVFTNQDLFDFQLDGKHFFKERIGDRYYYTMYSNSLPDLKIHRFLNKEIILEKDQYFVLGDNRADSYDSLSFGPIQFNNIEGELFFIYFSVNFRDYTCDPNTMELDTNYPNKKICPTDWFNHLIRSKIRFTNIGNRGYFNI